MPRIVCRPGVTQWYYGMCSWVAPALRDRIAHPSCADQRRGSLSPTCAKIVNILREALEGVIGQLDRAGIFRQPDAASLERPARLSETVAADLELARFAVN